MDKINNDELKYKYIGRGIALVSLIFLLIVTFKYFYDLHKE